MSFDLSWLKIAFHYCISCMLVLPAQVSISKAMQTGLS